MTVHNKIRWFIIVLMTAALLAIITAASFWQQMPADQRVYLGLLSCMAAFSLAALGFVVVIIFRHYMIPLRQIAEEITLMTALNPSHRIQVRGSRSVMRLVQLINERADRVEELQRSIDRKVGLACGEMQHERDVLAALMSVVPSGVLVCNVEGRILFYNRQARRSLNADDTLMNPGTGTAAAVSGAARPFIGLGRFVFDVLDRKSFLQVRDGMIRQMESGETVSGARPVLLDGGNRDLPADVHPIVNHRGLMTGLALIIRDSVERADAPEWRAWADPAFDGGGRPESVAVIPGLRPASHDFDLFDYAGPSREWDDCLLSVSTYTVFDTETTGLYPKVGDEIISIGAVRIVNGRLLREETFDQLVDPQRCHWQRSVRIHGILPESLAGRPTIDRVLPLFHRFAADSILVAHNAAFDMKMLRMKEARAGVKFEHPVLDTLLLSAVVHPAQENHTLEALAERLDVRIVGRHTAMGDVMATAQIFLKLIPLLAEMGIYTFGEARLASQKTCYARFRY
jgi:DNA polymerase III epsilon subunit family exonuclease